MSFESERPSVPLLRALRQAAAAFLFLLGATVPSSAFAADPDVQLVLNGKPAVAGDYVTTDVKSLVLDNGILKIGFGKDARNDFSAISVVKNGKELGHNLMGIRGPDRSFYLDYNAGRGHLDVQTVRVVKVSPDLVHIAMIDNRALRLEHHFVMLRGESGVHPWAIVDTRNANGAGNGEMRTMYKFDRNIMDYAWTNERTGQQPTYAQLQAISALGNVQDETWRLADGSIYQKYNYSAYFRDSPMWGHYGHGFGAWFIPVSVAAYSSGPLRQELVVHQDALILNYIGGGHYGGGGSAAGLNGVKLHGPWYLYVNSGETPEAIIADAKKTAEAERAKWPYQFVEDETLYPTKLTAVTGHIRVADGRSAAKAEVTLGKPGEDVYRQAGDFLFYAQADEKGDFSIPNVRPGTYTAFVWANQGSITQQQIKDGLEIKGDKTDVGEILWSPPHRNRLLWQIGESDHMTDGFKWSDAPRTIEWLEKIPASLTYTIGKSKPSDWYFAQTKPGDWNVVFNLDQVPQGKCRLSIGKAGQSNDPDIAVLVNGKEAAKLRFNSESATYRSAMRSGHYQNDALEFPASLLKPGENVLTFRMNSVGNRGGIMWDAIVLESD